MKERVLAFLLPVFIRKSNQLVDFIVENLIVWIEKAEEKFEDGKDKKDFVVDHVLELVNDQFDLNYIYRILAKKLIEGLVDLLIDLLNNLFDHDWINEINEYREIIKEFKQDLLE